MLVDSTISPADSIRPVNISFDQHIRPERFDSLTGQQGRRQSPSLEEPDARAAKHMRRDIEADEIDDPFVPCGGVQGGSAFDHH